MFRLFWAVMILVVTCVLSAMSGTTSANLEESIAYIREQLENGKKYAIILMGMQQGHSQHFLFRSKEAEIMQGQLRLLEAFTGTENVWFMQVNIRPEALGTPFPALDTQAKKFERYAQTILNDDSQLFSTTRNIRYSTEEAEDVIVTASTKQFFNERGVKDLFITGCWDHECILEAARNGAEEGFSVTVDRDLNILNYERFTFPPNSAFNRPLDEQAEDSDAAWWELKQEHPEVNVIGRTPKPCQES